MESKNYIRIGDIALRYCKFNGGEEIVKWEPNQLYGKMGDYIERKDKPGFYSKQKDLDAGFDYAIHKDCFAGRENSYVLAFIKWNKDRDCFDVRSVGERPFELEKEEAENYLEVVKWAFRHIDLFNSELEKDETKYKRPWEIKEMEKEKEKNAEEEEND